MSSVEKEKARWLRMKTIVLKCSIDIWGNLEYF